MASSAESKKLVEFLNRYSKLNSAVDLVLKGLKSGNIGAIDAKNLLSKNLTTLNQLKADIKSFMAANSLAIRQQGLTDGYQALLSNLDEIESSIKSNKTELEFKTSKGGKIGQENENRFSNQRQQYLENKNQLELAKKLCSEGKRSQANEIFAALLEKPPALQVSSTEVQPNEFISGGGSNSGAGASVKWAKAPVSWLRIRRELFIGLQVAKDNNISSQVSQYQAFIDTVNQYIKDTELAKTNCRSTTVPATTGSANAAPTANVAVVTTQPEVNVQGLQGEREDTRIQATHQDAINAKLKGDWRVRIALAPSADGYLYKVPVGTAGILTPLQETDGVIFPYTPDVTVTYSAKYDSVSPVHSNYNIYQYQGSAIDTVTIQGDFTAQDTAEANYLLAVIHFFRSATKMFYGQDENPKPGTPPPMCFLYGYGAYQFDHHPLVISQFTMQLPQNVDYIRATGFPTTAPGVDKAAARPADNVREVSDSRLQSNGQVVTRNGQPPPPDFSSLPSGTVEPTYVPTSLRISVTCLPLVSRNDVSRKFSLRDYATGKLLQGSKNSHGGFW